jgi:hypothetical protein
LGWREAEARGFRPAFILARKVDPSRDGKLFFIAELLAAPNWARWWRHRRDTSPSGQPFTPSYKSEAEAQRTLDDLERADAVAQAVELLVQAGVQAAERSVLDRAYRRATTDEEAISPGALAETYLQFCTWAEETRRLLQREEPRC